MKDNKLVRSKDVSSASHFFLFLCIVMCVAFLGWAYFFKLDIVSQAAGEVIPSSRVKRVQHLEGGIVRRIDVREGEIVKKGQQLMELEATASDSSVDELQIRMQSLQTNIARLEAEEKGLNYIPFPAELIKSSPELVDAARKLFETRNKRLESDLRTKREMIIQREQDITRLKTRLRNDSNSLKLLHEQISISSELLSEGLTTRYKHLSFLKEESRIKSAIEESVPALRKAESALAQAKAEIDEIQNSHIEEVRNGLKNDRQQLEELCQRLRKFEDNLARTVIRSPVNGVIKTLYVVSVGEVVKSGMTIMDIVPRGDKLVIEAHLQISDVGYVRKGQKAVIKLASRDASRFGSIDGTVVNISPDAYSSQSGQTYYNVRIETDKDHFEQSGNFYKLFPGIRVLAGIHIGKRSVMEYLLEPFMGSLSYAMRER